MTDSINTKLPRVFVGGPWTKPDPLMNINTTLKLRTQLQDSGLIHTVCPMSDTFMWGIVCVSDYETQTKFCFHELATCDIAVFRRGESSGRDQEIEICNQLGIPFFWDDELQKFWELVKEFNNTSRVPRWTIGIGS